MKMRPITKAEMELLDKLYVERCNEPELDPLLKELRELVLGTKFEGSIVPRTDPEFLAKYIRVRDYNVKKAHKNVIKYYKCISKHMDLHKGIKPSDVTPAFASKSYLVLKNRFDGVKVGYSRIKYWEPKEVSLLDMQRGFVMGAEVYMNDIGIQRHGVSGITDFEGLRFEHIWHATIKEIKRCAEVGLKGAPVRLIQGHAINVPKIFWPIYNFGKRFVKQKYIDRVHFHENLESLHKHFDKRFLPECLGGDLTEEEATETEVLATVLENDIPYEECWNGAIWKPSKEDMGRLNRLSVDLKSG